MGNNVTIIGISDRSDGSMTWGNNLPVAEEVIENRNKFFTEQGIDPARVVSGGIIHDKNVFVATSDEAGKYIKDQDALITDVSNLYLSITVADCLPVYFFDTTNKAIGIAHAGRKGIVLGILENVIKTMEREYGSLPGDIEVKIGPHVGQCHYDVVKEIADKFNPKNVEEREGKLFLNLAQESKMRLESVGVGKIEIDSTCTYCNADKLFSARHDKIQPVQGMVAYIGIK